MNDVEAEELLFVEVIQPTEIACFATGGMAQVWKGEWRPKDEWRPEGRSPPIPVVIKVLTGMHTGKVKQEKWIQRLKREHRCWRSVEHLNIVPFYGVSKAGTIAASPSPGLVSPLYKNGTITEYLDKQTEVSRGTRLNLIKDIAVGLEQLHSKWKIIHGDLKPSNVLISDEGRAAIADFGQSRIIDESGYTTKLGGSVRYMAPELHSEEDSPDGSSQDEDPNSVAPSTKRLTKASDVYAFSMTALEVTSGKQPFHVTPQEQVIVKLLRKNRPKPEHHLNTPRQLWPLLTECWSEESKDRPPMASVVKKLDTIYV